MTTVESSTAISFCKRDLIMSGIDECIEASIMALIQHSKRKFVDLILQDLKEEDNQYQFSLIIKKLNE